VRRVDLAAPGAAIARGSVRERVASKGQLLEYFCRSESGWPALVRSRSSDGVQPVELLDAIGEQPSADRFFHKAEGALGLSHFGFGLLGAKLGRELLVRLSADIGLGLLEGPLGVLELLLYRNHQLAIGALGGFRSHLGLPHFLRRLPTQKLRAGFSLACPVLRSAKCLGRLVHQIKRGRALVRPRLRVGKVMDVPTRKLIRPTPLLLHLLIPGTNTMRHYRAVMVNGRLSSERRETTDAIGVGVRLEEMLPLDVACGKRCQRQIERQNFGQGSVQLGGYCRASALPLINLRYLLTCERLL
jgi:hypothetical protein